MSSHVTETRPLIHEKIFKVGKNAFWIGVAIQVLLVTLLFLLPDPVIFVGLVLTLVVGALILLEPRVSLLAIAFITFALHPDFTGKQFVVKILGVNWYAMDWILLFTALSWCIHVALGRQRRMHTTKVTVPMVLFLVMLCVGVGVGLKNGHSPQDVFADLRLFFYYTAFFVALAFIRGQRDVELIFWATIVCGMVGAIPEIIGSLSESGRDLLTGQRLFFTRITGPHEVNYPMLLVASITMFPFVESLAKKTLIAGCVATSSLALLLGYTRGSWLAALAALVILLILFLRYTNILRRRFVAITFSVLGALTVFVILDFFGVFTVENLTVRATAVVSAKQLDISTLQRITELERAIEIFRGSPVLGEGLGLVYRFYAIGVGERSQLWLHNSYLYVLSKMGAAGLLSFLMLLGSAVLIPIRHLKQLPLGTGMGLLMAFSGMLFVLMVKSLTTWHLNTLTNSLFVGVILGVIASARSWIKNTSNHESSDNYGYER